MVATGRMVHRMTTETHEHARPIVFWGATGHARVLRELVESRGCRLVALFDNNPDVPPPFPDVPLFIGRQGFHAWRSDNPRATFSLAAIGGAHGRDRLELQGFLDAQGLRPIVARHPTAFVAADARLGRGCQVLARAAVCAGAVLGAACIINTAASVDHECRLEDGVHIGPGATLCGRVSVGQAAFVGAGAVVLPGIRVGEDAVVGAGAVVTRDVGDGVVCVGNPARVHARREAPVPQSA